MTESSIIPVLSPSNLGARGREIYINQIIIVQSINFQTEACDVKEKLLRGAHQKKPSLPILLESPAKINNHV